MNLREYLTIIRERWLIVSLTVGLAVGLGATAAFASTPQYVASVRFYISSRYLGNNLNEALQGSLLSEQKIKSYVDLASDRRIREQVSQQVGFPIAAGVISASSKADTVLLTLSAADPSPRRAQQIANLAAKDLADLVAEVERPDTGQPLVVAREIQPAALPTIPVSPHKGVDLGLGLILGLMAGVSVALVRHSLDRTVKSPEALAELAGAPILGTTQFDASIKTRPLIVHEQPRSPSAEAFRQLRTNLEYVDLDHTHKVMVVTSALPDEGKTTIACNLAIALAQSGNKVIVVEADLRRPKAASYLGMENAVGLTTVLTGQIPLEVAVQPWRGGLLDFLGAGALPPNPSELLASSQMAAVLSALSARYDAVILDAAPTVPVADAVVLAAHSNGVLFVARHGWVRAEQVKFATETIRRVGVPVLGVVMSTTPRVKRRSGRYQYGYTYGYTGSGRSAVRTQATPATAAVVVSTVPVAPPTAVPAVPVHAVPTPRAGSGLGAPPPPIKVLP